jgi:hypothetical protein
MIDRLKRTFKTNRSELLKQEEWSDSSRYFQVQRKLIITEWAESKKALLIKAEAVFAEAFELIEREKIKRSEKEKQQKVCEQLYEKVSRWRDQKLEALEIQQKLDKMIKKKNMEKAKLERDRKNEKREREKQAVSIL